jgi:hypothetical protein
MNVAHAKGSLFKQPANNIPFEYINPKSANTDANTIAQSNLNLETPIVLNEDDVNEPNIIGNESSSEMPYRPPRNAQ